MYNFGHDHDASFIPFFYKGVLSGRLRLPKDFFIICNMVQVYPAQTWIVLWLRPRLRKEIKNDMYYYDQKKDLSVDLVQANLFTILYI